MFTIDFASLPDISTRLNPNEINNLNALFRDPTVQGKLEEIEVQRKKRQKWKSGIYGACLLLFVAEIIIFNQINGGVIWSLIAAYSIGMLILYAKFASKIEIPLKSEVLAKMCPLLSPKLEYGYDTKYSFDELDLLRSKGFLNSYDTVNTVEDSVYCPIEKDGKIFSINGFELRTSETRGTRKNRRTVITNQCYLIKAQFPNARTPLTRDLYIVQDQADQKIGKNLILPIIAGIFGAIFIAAFSGKMVIAIVIGLILSGATYYGQKKGYNHKRIQLENIEFEKLFDVKCEDQVTSRMIITPAFMDRLVAFVHKTRGSYEFMLQNNTMYIKKNITHGYLEAGTEKNMLTNLNGFTQFYTDMREILQFTSDMNLLYLSKTDTSKAFEHLNENTTTKPIIFTKPLALSGVTTNISGLLPILLSFRK